MIHKTLAAGFIILFILFVHCSLMLKVTPWCLWFSTNFIIVLSNCKSGIWSGIFKVNSIASDSLGMILNDSSYTINQSPDFSGWSGWVEINTLIRKFASQTGKRNYSLSQQVTGALPRHAYVNVHYSPNSSTLMFMLRHFLEINSYNDNKINFSSSLCTTQAWMP